MVDEIDLLSHVKDAAPLRAEAFEEARTKLRAAMAASARPDTGPRAGGHPRRLAWGTRGRAGFAAAAAAAAAVAAVVLGTTLSPAPSHPAASHPAASHPAGRADARLADFAVSRQADGTIRITMFGDLRDPAALQRTLRADGVPASVTFMGQQNPACQVIPGPVLNGKPQGPAALNRVLPVPPHKGAKPVHEKVTTPVDDIVDTVINPSALPPGDGLQIAVMRGIPAGPAGPWPYPKGSGHPVSEFSLVKASQPCTGS